jgi:DNA replication and repair protein RecF
MFLQQLKVTNFKNYEAQSIELSEKLNCFVGQNGMGKTNLLDAIHYLCMCKSGITSGSDRLLVRHGEGFFRLDGTFNRLDKKENIVVKYLSGKPKVIERNQVPYSRISEHIGLLPVVMIAPNDTQLAMEGSEERRRFWNATISQLDQQYLKHLMTYNKIVSQRNAYLKGKESIKYALLDIYDEQLIAPANYILEKRKELTEILIPIFQNYYERISSGQETVGIEYKSKLLATNFETLLKENRDKDRILQRTTTGIHRDDWNFTFNGFPVKKFASQGQLKSYVLALKLAQYELLKEQKGLQPVLLLDDIFDKLDHTRVSQLLELLVQGDFGQVFITDTDKNRIATIVETFNVDYKKFIISNGNAVLEKKEDTNL